MTKSVQNIKPSFRRNVLVVAMLAIASVSASTLTSVSFAQDKKEANTAAPANANETVRAEIAKPLQAIQELMKEKKYTEALAKVKEAEAIDKKTPYEMFIIDQMRGAAAAGAGDNALAVKSFEAVLATNRLKPEASLPIVEAIAGTYFRSKDYKTAAKWAQRFVADGGSNPKMNLLLQQSLYLSESYAEAAKLISADIKATIDGGGTPSEDILKLLASCGLKQKDDAAYLVALQKLVTYYPKKDYWADYIYRFESKPGFTDRTALNLYRLKNQLNLVEDANDYVRYGLLANQAGFPAETKMVMEQGYANGVLGKGNGAAEHKKIKDTATKDVAEDAKTAAKSETDAMAAKDGTALVGIGYGYVINGQAEKGAGLIEQGIKKGGLKRPEEATLRLGMAYALAGQKQKAQDTLKTVQGGEGIADVAMLWSLYAGQVKK